VRKGTDKFEALLKMEELNVDWLPAVNDQQRFAGIVERSRLMASLLIDVTQSLKK